MKKIHYKIILPTTAKYLSVTDNFLSLLKLNWPKAMSNVVVSVVGSSNWCNRFNVEVVQNTDNCTLPECVKRAANKYKADIYLSFLGDAFVTKPIDEIKIEEFMHEILVNNIQYCRLEPQFNFHNITSKCLYRKLYNRERYGHSFVAFACTREFVNAEFSNDLTDRDFEIKYLQLAEKRTYIYLDRAILSKNIFHIVPCIQKGKWDLVQIAKLTKKYPNIKFVNLGTVSYRYEFMIIMRKILLPFLPNVVAKSIKMKLKKRTDYFDTDY